MVEWWDPASIEYAIPLVVVQFVISDMHIVTCNRTYYAMIIVVDLIVSDIHIMCSRMRINPVFHAVMNHIFSERYPSYTGRIKGSPKMVDVIILY